MLPVIDSLKSITHPLVSSIYMKKDFSGGKGSEDVLVIETQFPDPDSEHETQEDYLMDLLVDLEDIRQQAESRVGSFDRVDIRKHH